MACKRWTALEEWKLRELYPHLPTEMVANHLGLTGKQIKNKAAQLGLKKTPEYAQKYGSGRFEKGITPWNKGKHVVAGGNSAATRFKPGHRGGRAAQQYQPIGSERISRDGYLERKINDEMPFQKRWRAVHLLVWEEANGPLPKGCAIAFIDGDKRNINLANLECITRSELMRRNTVHNLPKELAEVVQLRGALTRQINKRMKDHEQKHQ